MGKDKKNIREKPSYPYIIYRKTAGEDVRMGHFPPKTSVFFRVAKPPEKLSLRYAKLSLRKFELTQTKLKLSQTKFFASLAC